MVRAQQKISDFIAGGLDYNELSPALKSAVRIHIYFRASALLDLSASERKKAAEQLPEQVRDLVREECKRLLKYRS